MTFAYHTKCQAESQEEVGGLEGGVGRGGAYIWHQLRNSENVCATAPPARVPIPPPSSTLIKKDVSG